ncbi:uncharacterized protein UV8b_07142 [Ustilaginoidea virens]|uniref:Uncharacterized protein n=1 Tax=Ustilaginoidea virens TaxID=1159556 RepID=A0A8E5HWL8_USTVR|nr:uncharacterized protein UV8b_07142 [Ustilaginoidea virens]QUC22901.1 hypothetical protein UV8b_07142 [Ustilaginoidea virens]
MESYRVLSEYELPRAPRNAVIHATVADRVSKILGHLDESRASRRLLGRLVEVYFEAVRRQVVQSASQPVRRATESKFRARKPSVHLAASSAPLANEPVSHDDAWCTLGV